MKRITERKLSTITKEFSMENLLSLISEPIDIIIEQEQSSYPTEQSELVEVTLPAYKPIPHIPTLPYNNLDGKSFVEIIDKAYNEIVKWKNNLFLVPTGNKGKELINELAHWLDQFNKNTTFKFISLKVFMVLPSLLLQKPSATSKTKDHWLKAIGWTLYDDILNAAGHLQASTGLKGGAEAAIHAMKEI